MLQPFEKLEPVYVHRLEAMNKKYFVTQHYPAGTDVHSPVLRVPLIVSVYGDPGLAKTHCNAVKADPLAAIIDLNKPAHKNKLYEMIRGDKYDIFWAVVRDAATLEKKINERYKDKMRHYIEKNTDWQINRDATLRPSIQLIFGELYINLKYGSQLIRTKFEEIDRL